MSAANDFTLGFAEHPHNSFCKIADGTCVRLLRSCLYDLLTHRFGHTYGVYWVFPLSVDKNTTSATLFSTAAVITLSVPRMLVPTAYAGKNSQDGTSFDNVRQKLINVSAFSTPVYIVFPS